MLLNKQVLIFTVALLFNANCSELESNMFSKKSNLQKIASQVEKGDSAGFSELQELRNYSISTKNDALAVIRLLKLQSFSYPLENHDFNSPVHSIVAFFQAVDTKEAFQILSEKGLPELRRLVDEGMKYPDERESDIMFILKILAMYQQEQDIDKIVSIIKSEFKLDDYMWSIILNQFNYENPHHKYFLNAMGNTIPSEFCGIAYLDCVNALAISGVLFNHPFSTVNGYTLLKAWLSSNEDFSYAHSATAAIPFLSKEYQSELLELARNHKDVGVKMESAWASIKCGNIDGIAKLKEWATEYKHSSVAVQYLRELGYEHEIPKECFEEDFVSKSEMCSWLSHPMEFGEIPDELELYDSRILYWPPTNDKRKVYLFKYTYNKSESRDEADIGLGMVGSVTFALFGSNSSDLTPEEAYGMHCAWELQGKEDSRAPKEYSNGEGLKILKQYNPTLTE